MPNAAIKTGAVRLPVNRSFERELAVLESMSGRRPDADGIEHVRKALGHDNNYLVAKAARIVGDNVLLALLPEVLAAYNRFFENAVKSDPQCWAKNALIKAVVALECREPKVYLRGLRHIQEEPVWGGYSDTAGALRGACTQALVLCEGIGDHDLLDILLTPLLDKDKTVRMEAARAIGHVGGPAATLLLKLRILLRKDDPEVMGACFRALLRLDGVHKENAIQLVSEFLDDGEDAALDAALALAETHATVALDALIAARKKAREISFIAALDQAIALSRLPQGLEFLLGLVGNDPRHGASALEAISRVYQSEEIRSRVATAVATVDNERALLAFRQCFPEDAP